MEREKFYQKCKHSNQNVKP